MGKAPPYDPFNKSKLIYTDNPRMLVPMLHVELYGRKCTCVGNTLMVFTFYSDFGIRKEVCIFTCKIIRFRRCGIPHCSWCLNLLIEYQ